MYHFIWIWVKVKVVIIDAFNKISKPDTNPNLKTYPNPKCNPTKQMLHVRVCIDCYISPIFLLNVAELNMIITFLTLFLIKTKSIAIH